MGKFPSCGRAEAGYYASAGCRGRALGIWRAYSVLRRRERDDDRESASYLQRQESVFAGPFDYRNIDNFAEPVSRSIQRSAEGTGGNGEGTGSEGAEVPRLTMGAGRRPFNHPRGPESQDASCARHASLPPLLDFSRSLRSSTEREPSSSR